MITIRYPTWFAATYTKTHVASRPMRRTASSRNSGSHRNRKPVARTEGHRAAVIATTPSVVPIASTSCCGPVASTREPSGGPDGPERQERGDDDEVVRDRREHHRRERPVRVEQAA